MSDEPSPLLNVYDLADETGRVRHVLAFVAPGDTDGSRLDSRSVVAEVTPREDGTYDATGVELNPAFVVALCDYMNEVGASDPDLVARARAVDPGLTYVLDPRSPIEPGVEPRQGDIVGAYMIDEDHRIAPGSFQYNHSHVLVDPEKGISGIFSDRKFYNWLHHAKV